MIALNVHPVALNVHPVALNVRTVALNVHPVALNVRTVVTNVHHDRSELWGVERTLAVVGTGGPIKRSNSLFV